MLNSEQKLLPPDPQYGSVWKHITHSSSSLAHDCTYIQRYNATEIQYEELKGQAAEDSAFFCLEKLQLGGSRKPISHYPSLVLSAIGQ